MFRIFIAISHTQLLL
jgi:Not1 N-terminal domain, CCR4-Not complex component